MSFPPIGETVEAAIQPTINQSPMNLKQKSKTSLVLLIIALVILTLTGGYFFYAQGLLKTAETSNTDQVGETDKKDEAVNDGAQVVDENEDESTIRSGQVPANWKSYILTNCGIKISVPPDWMTNNDLNDGTLIFNSPESIENKKKDWLSQGPTDIADDLTIRCYKSLDGMTHDSWKKIQQSYPEFPPPIDLYDVLTRKNPIGGFTVFTTQDVEKIKIGIKDAIKAIEGGEIMMTNYYFQNTDGLIVEFHIYIDNADRNLDIQSPQSTIFETFSWL